MEQAIAARKRMGTDTRSPADPHGAEAKRTPGGDAVLEKLDLLDARAAVELRRRRERQDQQLLDERAWRRGPLQKGESGYESDR